MVEEFLAFMVLLNYIIPISMYVTVGEYTYSEAECCRFVKKIHNKNHTFDEFPFFRTAKVFWIYVL